MRNVDIFPCLKQKRILTAHPHGAILKRFSGSYCKGFCSFFSFTCFWRGLLKRTSWLPISYKHDIQFFEKYSTLRNTLKSQPFVHMHSNSDIIWAVTSFRVRVWVDILMEGSKCHISNLMRKVTLVENTVRGKADPWPKGFKSLA